MVIPFSAGTLTLPEAPSFAWRTNGSALTRAERSEGTAQRRRVQRLVRLRNK